MSKRQHTRTSAALHTSVATAVSCIITAIVTCEIPPPSVRSSTHQNASTPLSTPLTEACASMLPFDLRTKTYLQPTTQHRVPLSIYTWYEFELFATGLHLARSPSSCAMIPAPIIEGAASRPGRQRCCCCCRCSWCLRCHLDDVPNAYPPPLSVDSNDSQLLDAAKDDRWFHAERGQEWNAKEAPVVTAGTRNASINDCHGHGPVDWGRLGRQLGCAFLMMPQAVRCWLRVSSKLQNMVSRDKLAVPPLGVR